MAHGVTTASRPEAFNCSFSSCKSRRFSFNSSTSGCCCIVCTSQLHGIIGAFDDIPISPSGIDAIRAPEKCHTAKYNPISNADVYAAAWYLGMILE
jgi:hypothetical protein